MRVAHVIHTFPPYYGGSGNVCLGNARALATRGHEVHVFTAAQRGLPPVEVGGIRVHRLRPLFRIGNAPCLPQLARLRGFDVVHLHYPFVFGAEWVMLAEARDRFPLVVTCHQDLAFTGALGVAQFLYEGVVKRRVVARARRICVPTLDALRHSALAPAFEQAPHRFVEVPNGVDAKRFSPGPDPVTLRERYALGANPVILFVGGLDRPHKFKGVEVLLRAFQGLRRDARLVIVGDGDLRPRFEQEARSLGVHERIVFAGRVEDDTLPDHYRLADVVVLPSTTREEIFGLVLLEALATGKPVVASSLPGVRTVVDPGVDGLLVDPGDVHGLRDALADLLARAPAARAAMGQAGREKVRKRYAWEAIGARLEAVYQEVAR